MKLDTGKKESDQSSTAPSKDYRSLIKLAKICITEREYEAAIEHLRRAVSLETTRPDAFNLLGATTEILGDVLKAQKYYRAALSFEPSYVPAQKNLHRTVSWRREGEITL